MENLRQDRLQDRRSTKNTILIALRFRRMSTDMCTTIAHFARPRLYTTKLLEQGASYTPETATTALLHHTIFPHNNEALYDHWFAQSRVSHNKWTRFLIYDRDWGACADIRTVLKDVKSDEIKIAIGVLDTTTRKPYKFVALNGPPMIVVRTENHVIATCPMFLNTWACHYQNYHLLISGASLENIVEISWTSVYHNANGRRTLGAQKIDEWGNTFRLGLVFPPGFSKEHDHSP